MNEELQRRAHEAAKAASDAWWHEGYKNEAEECVVVADAALAVVADWCDEQRSVGAPEHYNAVMTSGIWMGWKFAHECVAGACRPVEGDSKLSPADDPGSLDRGEDQT